MRIQEILHILPFPVWNTRETTKQFFQIYSSTRKFHNVRRVVQPRPNRRSYNLQSHGSGDEMQMGRQGAREAQLGGNDMRSPVPYTGLKGPVHVEHEGVHSSQRERM
ncbi:hypothetical protein J6590_013389 [Homalodisca vitripennis]|nr:hypothetical protein J6590_013389 [Homalodisca vitripennis]